MTKQEHILVELYDDKLNKRLAMRVSVSDSHTLKLVERLIPEKAWKEPFPMRFFGLTKSFRELLSKYWEDQSLSLESEQEQVLGGELLDSGVPNWKVRVPGIKHATSLDEVKHRISVVKGFNRLITVARNIERAKGSCLVKVCEDKRENAKECEGAE